MTCPGSHNQGVLEPALEPGPMRPHATASGAHIVEPRDEFTVVI